MPVESMVMQQVKSILKQFGNKYIDNDNLKRTRIIEDLDKYDKELMQALLSDKLIHDTYTEKILNIEVFKLNQFIEMLEYKEFWQDSFTRYSNRIGLANDGKFIGDSSDVVLDFPYKDSVLRAGMTKEDSDPDIGVDEPFLNEALARNEISELFEPKILINAKRYDKDGEHNVTEFNDEDNLVIKGNNLIALHSIKKRYKGTIKLIYIDVPFNTKNDSFRYNDKFSRSTWLTFMKNRLEIAKDLLAPNGSIFVHLDENESHYLKVLLDEIFGEDKFINEIIWRYRTYIGQVKDYFPKKHDVIYWYIKDKKPNFKRSNVGNFEDTPDYKRWKNYLNKDGEIVYGKHPNNDSRFDAYLRKYIKQNGTPEVGDIIYKNNGYVVDDVWDDIIALDAKNKSERIRTFSGSGQKPEALIQRIINAVTDKDDIIMDFFMGSATTQAVAMKMHRRFIGIEQMDYINSVSVPRLQKVIKGEDQGGISKDVNWQGGGSFVYTELMEKNQVFLKDLQKATTSDELNKVYQRMKKDADFDFRVDLDKYDMDLDKYKNKHKHKRNPLSFPDQKKLLIKMLDKNQLYYNEANIDDTDVKSLISNNDYKFNKSFYSGKESD